MRAEPRATRIRLSDDPRVEQVDDFLSPAERDAMIAAALPQLKRAEVSAAAAGTLSPGRTGSNCWVKHDHDATIHALAARLSALVGLPLEQAESFQVVHYRVGEEYRPHFDAYDPATERGRRCMARGGQRLLTCLLYLNDVAEGGGTAFPKLGLEVQPKSRRLLLFSNVRAGTSERHPHSLHGGLPVARGEKFACNLWFRERDRSL